MSITNQALVRIANLQVTIGVPGLPNPYVLQAEPYQPSDMSSVSCPFWVNEIRGGPADLPISSGMQYITTRINMMLAVARRDAAIDLKYNVETTLKWRDAVLAMFAQHIKLSEPSVLVKSSTNTNPIIVTTTTPHCLTNGNDVTIASHLVNTNANGTRAATVIDYLTFSIPVAGNGVGGQTGTARAAYPGDLNTYIVDAVIIDWDVVPYVYGSAEFIALKFVLRLREMYNQVMDG